MLRLSGLSLPLDHSPADMAPAICARLGIAADVLRGFTVFKRGNDARRKNAILLVYTLDVDLIDEAAVLHRLAADQDLRPTPDMVWHPRTRAPEGWSGTRPVVIGAGPCGLFAGLVLAQMGFRPIIIDRGKEVRQRTKDTWGLWRRGELNPDSNVQFGEGGAGTFSDGKLYCRVKDPRFLGRKVLEEFARAGAPGDILWEAHPHIGTFRLVTMVESLRATIEELGGEYRWETRVDDLELERQGDGRQRLRGLHLGDGSFLAADQVVLAVGHSARPTFEMLHARGVHLEAKPFSIGVRIEHPQSWVDEARFGRFARHPLLGPAAYSLVHHCRNDRTVYSFCMCPGGRVVAATSEVGHVVTNGMSQYSRAEFNANSGFVVGVDPARDFPDGPLAGLAYQRHWESLAFAAGGGTYAAPGQRVADFLAGCPSRALGAITPSYKPGVTPADLATCLPDFAVDAMREALPIFGRRIARYDDPDVVMTGVETRTSSPLRITRGKDLQSLNTARLFPAGEGAGYAGGILSAAIDGIKAGEAVAASIMAA